MTAERRTTSTSSFGAGRRESHDASGFYARFTPPVLSADEELALPVTRDRIFLGDSREMDPQLQVADKSVALMVTSPPYFAGKEYEQELGRGHAPATYLEYLAMLREVLAVCARKLEPGGRMAINVANLGRKPYRSLAADVVTILQDDLGMLLRGEIIWMKARGTVGSCAWGSFQSPTNPVLRDLTERVIVASKGRFDRAVDRKERTRRGLPSEGSITVDDFLEATTDVWEIPPESATRVGHPAPFPVELPQRLIELYTYRGDLVLDPFMGSGSTAVAAVRTGRHFVGFDTDARYVATAEERVAAERRHREAVSPATSGEAAADGLAHKLAVREGRKAQEVARALLEDCGYSAVSEGWSMPEGATVDFVAEDAAGESWYFRVWGAFTAAPSGLRRSDTLWRALGEAAMLAVEGAAAPLVFLTTELPRRGSPADAALRRARGAAYFDAVELLSPAGQQRLRRYAAGGARHHPIGDLLDPRQPSASASP